MSLSVDEVDKVLVLEERTSNCTTAIVHVAYVVVKTRQVLYKIFDLPYRIIKNSAFFTFLELFVSLGLLNTAISVVYGDS